MVSLRCPPRRSLDNASQLHPTGRFRWNDLSRMFHNNRPARHRLLWGNVHLSNHELEKAEGYQLPRCLWTYGTCWSFGNQRLGQFDIEIERAVVPFPLGRGCSIRKKRFRRVEGEKVECGQLLEVSEFE